MLLKYILPNLGKYQLCIFSQKLINSTNTSPPALILGVLDVNFRSDFVPFFKIVTCTKTCLLSLRGFGNGKEREQSKAKPNDRWKNHGDSSTNVYLCTTKQNNNYGIIIILQPSPSLFLSQVFFSFHAKQPMHSVCNFSSNSFSSIFFLEQKTPPPPHPMNSPKIIKQTPLVIIKTTPGFKKTW